MNRPATPLHDFLITAALMVRRDRQKAKRQDRNSKRGQQNQSENLYCMMGWA